MRRVLLFVLSALLSVPFFAQSDDPVVMKVNGYDVKKSEFEYFFRNNNTESEVTGKALKQYADQYLNFKLKVQAAIDEGMDKTESFLNEYGMYRGMQAESYLIDTAYLEAVAKEIYLRTSGEVGSDGYLLLYIMSSRPKEASVEAFRASMKKMESVHEKLKAGESFQELAKQYSEDDLASKGGEFGWVTRNEVPEDFVHAIFSLEPGEFTEPLTLGGNVFLAMAADRRELGTYEEQRDVIYDWMRENTTYYEDSKRYKANKYATRLGWDVRDKEAVAYMDSVLEELEPDFCNISREYHDGLLMFEISSKEVWEKTINDTEGMEKWFKANKKMFRFKEPHFKGMVFFCTDEDVFRKAESAVKGLDLQNWVDTLAKFNKDYTVVRVMKGPSGNGIFAKGQNEYVDKLVFGEGDFKPMEDLPYTNVVGKKIDSPENMYDVVGQVTEEYQKYLERQWIKKLRKQYKYKIYRKELKKVSLKDNE